MSIIEAIQDYIKDCTELDVGAPVWVNYLGNEPVEYSIVPIPGSRILETYLDGSSLRVYPFAFQSVESTADDLERLGTQGFYEAFADWLEEQTTVGNLPVLDYNKQSELLEATGWGYLFQEGESATGIYQIQCQLQYIQYLDESESS
jgi:hypothetical protein